MRVLGRSTRRGARGVGNALEHSGRRLRTLVCAPIVLGGLATLLLALLNGDLRSLPSTAFERTLIALAEVGLLTAFFYQTGLLRPTGLALRSPWRTARARRDWR